MPQVDISLTFFILQVLILSIILLFFCFLILFFPLTIHIKFYPIAFERILFLNKIIKYKFSQTLNYVYLKNLKI